MRSTKASAAVERLKTRSGNSLYSMSSRPDGLFALRGVIEPLPETILDSLKADELELTEEELAKLG